MQVVVFGVDCRGVEATLKQRVGGGVVCCGVLVLFVCVCVFDGNTPKCASNPSKTAPFHNKL